MTTYCEYCNSHPEDTFNRNYHDTQYGFPLADDNALFEHLVLEINQAGLSWITILKKAGNFHRAYDGFDVETVAGYGESDRARLPWTVRRPPVPAVLAQAGQAGGCGHRPQLVKGQRGDRKRETDPGAFP